jgi:hypothetical protein
MAQWLVEGDRLRLLAAHDGLWICRGSMSEISG